MSDTLTFDDLIDELDQAAAVIEAGAAVVLAKSSSDLVAIAQGLVPVKTSATKNSIGTTVVGPFVYVTGPTTWYSPLVEFGSGGRPPKPFMGPATTLIEPGFLQACAQLGVTPFLRGQGGYTASAPSGTTYAFYGPVAA